jgi:hypothetical protein
VFKLTESSSIERERKDGVMYQSLLYELEQSYVRPGEIEKRLELARLIREAQDNRFSWRERMLLLLSGLLISLGEGLKARTDPTAVGASFAQPLE